MKTTLEMPEATLRKAKALAAERGVPLHQFITEAVDEKLARSAASTEKPWAKMAGGLKHLHAETVHIQKLIDEEFEPIEPKDQRSV